MAISHLGHDVLWRIFLMNANLDVVEDLGKLYELNKGPPRYTYSALTITRRTSQVCQSWRDLILGSSSIWGRVIHLDFLNQETSDWREELLRRTGEAPLCVKGEVMGYVVEDFFLSLLETEWSRIRRLDVRIHNEWEFEDETWEPLLRPTSSLECFNLNYSYSNSRILSGSKVKLFSNNAPSLREFYSSGIPFSLQASWIPQLRHITLSLPFNGPQILDALKSMLFLESIQLEDGIVFYQTGVGDPPLPHIVLPHLRNVAVTGHFGTCTQFLVCITPSLGCGVNVDSTNKKRIKEMTSQELKMAESVFSRYSQNYFDVYTPTRVVLRLCRGEFHIHDLLDPIRLPSSPTFKLDIHSSPSSPISVFINCITITPMAALTHLDLQLSAGAIEPHNQHFIRFMYCLSSLEVLQISSMATLEFLRSMTWTHSTPFPALHTIKMVQSMTQSTKKLVSELMQPFLKWRVQLRFPITVLDLTFCDTGMFGNLTFLESFPGLKLRWSSQGAFGEYLCGRRTPGALRF
ncbi:hypothetical protein GALMADRAFT_153475 [Galerina marginata CBS 339.88]|uniref:F-box domain-containing protein n=1 Tax=Galerina marginata (strain CBS 339.88) TaxID=685588 RepID=A0A067TD92_GALM3|nr:hypothetical protein GALMADRAFT_153475 [Galerina marginata CBS 339.88]